jgi:hypothetical protein
MTPLKPLAPFAILTASLLLSACSAAELNTAFDAAKAVTGDRAAVGAAETIRVVVVEEAKKRALPVDSLLLLAEIAKGVPGATLLVSDADANDRDDDGKITVLVKSLDGAACLLVPTATTTGSTTAGACS